MLPRWAIHLNKIQYLTGTSPMSRAREQSLLKWTHLNSKTLVIALYIPLENRMHFYPALTSMPGVASCSSQF